MKVVRLVINVLIISIFSSCVHFAGSDSNSMIVERSKKNRPKWVDFSQNQFTEVGDSDFLAISRLNQTNLTLSFKQVEHTTVSKAEKLLFEQLKKKFEYENIKIEDLDGTLLSEIQKNKVELFIVKDIYFEKILRNSRVKSNGSSEYFFDTYALIEIPKTKQDFVFSQLLEKFDNNQVVK